MIRYPLTILIVMLFSPFIFNTIFLKGQSDSLSFLYLVSLTIGLPFFPHQILNDIKSKFRHALKVTGMSCASYFRGNLFADLSILSFLCGCVFILSSLFNLSFLDHLLIFLGNLVFLTEMISLVYLCGIVVRDSNYFYLRMT